MTIGCSLVLVYLLIKVLIARVLIVQIMHRARGGEVTPGDLTPGNDVLHGADPGRPVEQRHPVQEEEAEEMREQLIPPPVKPYSEVNEGIE